MMDIKEIDKKEMDELARKRVENAKNSIAKSLNMLEGTVQELKWSCEQQDWNDEVAYQIEEAVVKLGYALATLTRWYADETVRGRE